MSRFKLYILSTLFLLPTLLSAQIRIGGSDEIDYANPRTYKVGGVTVSGTQNLDQKAILLLCEIREGDELTIPGDDISRAIRNLWKQGLFSDVEITYTKVVGDEIFLDIRIEEQPRLSRFKFNGVSKSDADELREQINLYREKIVTRNLIVNTRTKVKSYFVGDGYYNADVQVIQKNDSLFPNHVILTIDVNKGDKVHIANIYIEGNEAISDRALKRSMKDTKERAYFRPLYQLASFGATTVKHLFSGNRDTLSHLLQDYTDERIRLNIFKSSKLVKSTFKTDQEMIVAKYQEKGYRDASITYDSIYSNADGDVNLIVGVEEGEQYYFGDIKWIGNTKYSTELLSAILGIQNGDIYNPSILEQRLFMNQAGMDVSSLYMDDGYLFFNVNPVEIRVDSNHVDLEIRMYEGQQARINKILISGNTKTNEHVIRREIRTRPGDLFSRSEIMRTQRELSILGYFDPEQMNVIPKPNPADGTVDIEYVVAERPTDQIELSGGWGGGRLVGTLGLSFSNFSLRKLFDKDAWRPLPMGDGQKLSLRAQTNGAFWQSYSLAFTEPWLGGKKPNSFTFSIRYNVNSNGEPKYIEENILNPARNSVTAGIVSFGLGKRLKWPDDYFSLYQEISFQRYDVNGMQVFKNFTEGLAHNFFYRAVISRSSVSDLNFPRSGSVTSLSVQLTPPYSWFSNKDYGSLPTAERYNLVEYNKWKFTSAWYTKLTRSEKPLVLYTKIGVGILGGYTRAYGDSPFERFYMGGSGLTGFQLDGREIIALRGYDDASNTQGSVSPTDGANLINKYTVELRYPFSLSQSAMIYGLAFAEAGNTWNTFEGYDPFNVMRAAGVGVRVFLPMFGLMGLDWGYRFDDSRFNPNMDQSQIHFTIGANLGEL